MKIKPANNQVICSNKKAAYRFELLEKFECGIVLQGTEVKSLRDKQGSLNEAFARLDQGQLWLWGFHVPMYPHAGPINHDPLRKRKLLLHRNQIRKLIPKVQQRGLTLVPISAYFNDRGLVKIKLALARGKTHGDKRQAMKTRDHQREMAKAMHRKRR